MIRIKRGLTLPLAGEPEQVVYAAPSVTRVGIDPADYPGLDLVPCVAAGARITTGAPLLRDRRFPDLIVAAPATGRVDWLPADADTPQTLTIAVETDEFTDGAPITAAEIADLDHAAIGERLRKAGFWPAFRTRPLSQIPAPDAFAHAIFVTAMDTQPLAARADWLIEAEQDAFNAGLSAISRLTIGLVYVCKAPAAYVPVPDIENIKVEEFAGPHPAGLAGTHIHFLDPVGADTVKQVWSIGYQDVIAIGRLLLHGRYMPERIIALAGPQVIDPRLLRVRQGAAIGELIAGQLREGDTTVIAGSVFAGQQRDFLGPEQLQITALPSAAAQRDWLGVQRFSVLPLCFSHLLKGRKFRLATQQPEPAYPPLYTAAFERIWPLRLAQRPLLRALQEGNAERAIALGALELAEEDLALCSFVCPGKQDFGPMLRKVLQPGEVQS